MSDRERQLESEVAWLRYPAERMNLALRERNAVWNEREKSESGSDEDEDKPEEFGGMDRCSAASACDVGWRSTFHDEHVTR